jgi:hypothetical protein
VAISPGERLYVPVLLHNDSSEAQELTLKVALPEGWTELNGTARYPVGPRETYPVEAVLLSPSKNTQAWQEITWNATANGRAVGSIALRVQLASGGLPQ